jgi:hypothetical protein
MLQVADLKTWFLDRLSFVIVFIHQRFNSPFFTFLPSVPASSPIPYLNRNIFLMMRSRNPSRAAQAGAMLRTGVPICFLCALRGLVPRTPVKGALDEIGLIPSIQRK